MVYDLWFKRIDDNMVAWVVSEPGVPWSVIPSYARSVSDVYQLLRIGGHTVAQVGIADLD